MQRLTTLPDFSYYSQLLHPILRTSSIAVTSVTAGELAAERQRNKPTPKAGTAEAGSPTRGYFSAGEGHIAVCLSPSAAKCKQYSAAIQPASLQQKAATVYPAAAAAASMQRVSSGKQSRQTDCVEICAFNARFY